MHWDANKIFTILPFYRSYIDKPKVKNLNNAELLKELPFYDGRSYKIEILDKKDVIVQLKSSEISTIELFKDLLVELKGFKYQITLAVLLSKVKNSGEIEYSPVYFNSLTKTVINEDYKLDQSFQEIIHRLDSWISNGSG